MVCIHCAGKTAVINSRLQKRSNRVWRRRKCIECGAIFSSHEVAQYEASWMVRGSGAKGKLTPFQRDKLFLSLYRSCQHRPAALSDASALADTIISKLQAQIKNGIVDGQAIFQAAQVALNRFDTAASVHYQAFHPS